MEPQPFVAPQDHVVNRPPLLPCPFTPAGIQMPRHMQPPPMYGPRGSTIPPRHLGAYNRNATRYRAPYRFSNTRPYGNHHSNQYRNQNQRFFCDVCDREFGGEAEWNQHKAEHQKCSIDGCDFEGHQSIVAKHIEQQHTSGLFKKIKNLSTPEDVAKWRSERRKRYPTSQNIELRQQLQAEKLKRGERLEDSKSRFGRKCDRRQSTQTSQQQQQPPESNNNKKKKEPRKRQRRAPKARQNESNQGGDKAEAEHKPAENSEVSNGSLQMFSGTLQMDDYKRPQKSTETKFVNPLSSLLGMYASSSTEDSSAEDDEPVEMAKDLEIESNIKDSIPVESNQSLEITESEFDDTLVWQSIVNNDSETNVRADSFEITAETNHFSGDEEPPEEMPVDKKPDEIVEVFGPDKADSSNNEQTCKRKHSEKTVADQKVKQPKRNTLLDLSKRYRNQNTMLEKLLQKEIRHERNVLLQCVRYVVENSFFENKQSEG